MGGIDILGSNLVGDSVVAWEQPKQDPLYVAKRGKRGKKATYINFFWSPQASMDILWVLEKKGKTIALTLQEPYLEIIAGAMG